MSKSPFVEQAEVVLWKHAGWRCELWIVNGASHLRLFDEQTIVRDVGVRGALEALHLGATWKASIARHHQIPGQRTARTGGQGRATPSGVSCGSALPAASWRARTGCPGRSPLCPFDIDSLRMNAGRPPAGRPQRRRARSLAVAWREVDAGKNSWPGIRNRVDGPQDGTIMPTGTARNRGQRAPRLLNRDAPHQLAASGTSAVESRSAPGHSWHFHGNSLQRAGTHWNS